MSHPLNDTFDAFLSKTGTGKKLILIGEVHQASPSSRNQAGDFDTLVGKQIHIIETIKQKIPSPHLYFELPMSIATQVRTSSKFETLTPYHLLKYNTTKGHLPEHFAKLEGSTAKLMARAGPPLERANDHIYAAEIKDVMKSCDCLIVIIGLAHLPVLRYWLREFNPLCVNATFKLDTVETRQNVYEMIPELRGMGEDFDLFKLAPFFEDPDAKKWGKEWIMSARPSVSPLSSAVGAGVGAGAGAGPGEPGSASANMNSISKNISAKELRKVCQSKGINCTGFSEKSEYLNALRAKGVTIRERSRKSRRRNTRKNRNI